jgi:DNA repair protein RadC
MGNSGGVVKGRLRISDWHPSERPREKMLGRGLTSLSDAELTALVIRNGTMSATALDLARSLLTEFGSLSKLASRKVAELTGFRGIGVAKAVSIVAAFEMGRRAASDRGDRVPTINAPSDVVRLYMPALRDLKQEVFIVLLLDSANHLMRDVTITTGILNSSLVHPREVFQPAILEPAAGVILLHNHPSGNPEPSAEDVKVTRQLVESGKILGIPVHDHIIVAAHESSSFAEKGLL